MTDCIDCGKPVPLRPGKGRHSARCPGCKDSHAKEYMRNYSRMKRLKEKKHFVEKIEKKKERPWNLENILDSEEIFKYHALDSGTGIDKGSSED